MSFPKARGRVAELSRKLSEPNTSDNLTISLFEFGNSKPMKLFPEAMGDFHFAISSSSEEAQQYFDQGFQLMYAFAKDDAARSFQASHFADPSCAICWWGEAWAWGSYLNGAMTTAQAPRAYFALQEALKLSLIHI